MPSAGRGSDARQRPLSGDQQSLALTGTPGGQQSIAAGHQALTGIIGSGDRGAVALVEQRHLQRPLGKLLDLPGAQATDPIKTSGFDLIVDARRGDHATIPTSTTWRRPKRRLSLSICAPTVLGSPVFPRTPQPRSAVRRGRKADRRQSAAGPAGGRGDTRAALRWLSSKLRLPEPWPASPNSQHRPSRYAELTS